MAVMGRKPIEIDEKVVEAFANLGATNTEIASFFMCDETTIRRRFADLLEKCRATRRIRLRELQWNAAEKGNVAMLIWLGKQYLGQTDKVENSTDIKSCEIVYSPMTKDQAQKLLDEKVKDETKESPNGNKEDR